MCGGLMMIADEVEKSGGMVVASKNNRAQRQRGS